MSIHIEASEKFLLGNLNTVAIAATDVFYTQNLSGDIYGGDTEERNYDGLNAGQDVPVSRLNPTNAFSFDLDYVASGSLGVAPAASMMMQACGFKETTAAGVDVTYSKEAISDLKSVDLEMRHMVEAAGARDYLYKTTDAKGQVGLTLGDGQTPMLNFTNMTGEYITPSDVTGVVPDYGTLKSNLALPANADNTLVVTIGGKSLCVGEFSCSNLSGYEATRKTLPGGCKYTKMSAGIVEFTLTFLSPDWTSEFNPFAYAETGSGIQRFAFQMTHGVNAGEILDLTCSEVQVLPGVSATDIDGELAFSVTCRALQSFVLVAK